MFGFVYKSLHWRLCTKCGIWKLKNNQETLCVSALLMSKYKCVFKQFLWSSNHRQAGLSYLYFKCIIILIFCTHNIYFRENCDFFVLFKSKGWKKKNNFEAISKQSLPQMYNYHQKLSIFVALKVLEYSKIMTCPGTIFTS